MQKHRLNTPNKNGHTVDFKSGIKTLKSEISNEISVMNELISEISFEIA